MNSSDVLDVIARLGDAGVEYVIEGGWGVDALLGRQTRPHDDLDLGVPIDHVDRMCAALPEFTRSDDDWPSAFVLRDAHGRKVDCHPLTFDENGDGWQANRTGGPPYRWPREQLNALGTIDGAEVRCISPELQIRWHVYDDFDDVDWYDMTALADRFGLELPPEHRERPGFVAAKREYD